MKAGPAQHGAAVAVASGTGQAGKSILFLQQPITIQPNRPYVFSGYLRRAGTGALRVQLQLACFTAAGDFLYNIVPADIRALRPGNALRAPDANGYVPLRNSWTRVGGFVSPGAWPDDAAKARPQLVVTFATGSLATVLIDAVELRVGTAVEEFSPDGPNLVADPSFERGGLSG